jgi:hypothetical protein
LLVGRAVVSKSTERHHTRRRRFAAGDLHAIKAVRAQAGHAFVPFQFGPEGVRAKVREVVQVQISSELGLVGRAVVEVVAPD